MSNKKYFDYSISCLGSCIISEVKDKMLRVYHRIVQIT